MLVHPDFTPTRWQLISVKAFIFLALCLPYLTPCIYWALSDFGYWLKIAHPLVWRCIAGAMAILALGMVPANVYWDCR